MGAFFRIMTVTLALGSGVLGGRPIPPRPSVPKAQAPSTPPVRVGSNGTTQVLPPYNTIYYFDQLIDHHNPLLGTFKQRYYFTYEFYQPGGPIILNAPGESSMDGYSSYLTNCTLPGQIAQVTNGAIVFLEHQCFGESNPYPNLDESTLKYLSVEQAIEGYSSSGVVQAINWYWGYFELVCQYMPKNCSADVQKVVNYIDTTFTFGTCSQIQKLKETLGMGNLSHVDDVAGTLRNPLWYWQSLQTGQSDQSFYRFCDALEVKDGISASPNGWGLDHALTAYGDYMKGYIAETLRRIAWVPTILIRHTTLISRLTTHGALGTGYCVMNLASCKQVLLSVGPQSLHGWSYHPMICVNAPISTQRHSPRHNFPNTFNINTKYAGWNVNVPRLFFANGKRDPWREATVSSDFYTRKSTKLQPIAVSDGFHCSDLLMRFGAADKTVYDVQQLAIAYFTKWIKEWQDKNPGAVKGGAVTVIDLATKPAPPAFVPLASPPADASPITVPCKCHSTHILPRARQQRSKEDYPKFVQLWFINTQYGHTSEAWAACTVTD
ncbi:hypothetical protein OPQ81_001929 [Rhizoctonia solani]|nr:hypothetical protein OPQ81_001929 [Rhizoctonia solani]